MTEPTDLLEHAMGLFTGSESGVIEVHRGLARRQRNRRLAAGAVAVGIWVVIGLAAVTLRSDEGTVPAKTPSPTVVVSGTGIVEGSVLPAGLPAATLPIPDGAQVVAWELDGTRSRVWLRSYIGGLSKIHDYYVRALPKRGWFPSDGYYGFRSGPGIVDFHVMSNGRYAIVLGRDERSTFIRRVHGSDGYEGVWDVYIVMDEESEGALDVIV